MRRANGACGFGDRSLKPEALVDKHNIVVDGLGNAHHSDLPSPSRNTAGDSLRAAKRTVASDHKEHVDAHGLHAIDDLFGVLFAARYAENGAALLVDAGHVRWRKV